jgi:hypothetical protein
LSKRYCTSAHQVIAHLLKSAVTPLPPAEF